MTLEEFYERLKIISDWDWRIDDDDIRAYAGAGNTVCCPITAVCMHDRGETYTIGQFEEAAESLGLDQDLAAQIANAADDASDPVFDTEWSLLEIRARLIEILHPVERKGGETA